MGNDKLGHVRKDWTVHISIDEHKAKPGRRQGCAGAIKRRSASVWPGSIRPTATSMTSAMNRPSRARWPTWLDDCWPSRRTTSKPSPISRRPSCTDGEPIQDGGQS
jgi:hypothetical protein